jgi:hypothetical protein
MPVQVLLNGTAVDPGLIQSPGLTPGLAGVYQVNVQLPNQLVRREPADPAFGWRPDECDKCIAAHATFCPLAAFNR